MAQEKLEAERLVTMESGGLLDMVENIADLTVEDMRRHLSLRSGYPVIIAGTDGDYIMLFPVSQVLVTQMTTYKIL